MIGAFDPRPIARRFWERAGVWEPFPRRLTPTIAAILPVAVILIPKLTIEAVAKWLTARGANCLQSVESRSLSGCLVAQRGHAFIFVDASLAAAEQRLTIGHETAHFLFHYEAPRETALTMIGPSVEAALDGDRAATANERLRGALRGVKIGVYEHMLVRAGGAPDAMTFRQEAEADLIAFELLAPMSAVVRETGGGEECRIALVERYGLPEWAAARWGAWIDAHRRGDSFLRRLEASRRNSR
jgi:hypothetical protein